MRVRFSKIRFEVENLRNYRVKKCKEASEIEGFLFDFPVRNPL